MADGNININIEATTGSALLCSALNSETTCGFRGMRRDSYVDMQTLCCAIQSDLRTFDCGAGNEPYQFALGTTFSLLHNPNADKVAPLPDTRGERSAQEAILCMRQHPHR